MHIFLASFLILCFAIDILIAKYELKLIPKCDFFIFKLLKKVLAISTEYELVLYMISLHYDALQYDRNNTFPPFFLGNNRLSVHYLSTQYEIFCKECYGSRQNCC